mmetsp:Transcript_18925/g.35472  ORF Transcript_18925/g.35472 Transcript_18925/m.35472 type:complete len:361 (+) Transcript_18925:71-1153(+)
MSGAAAARTLRRKSLGDTPDLKLPDVTQSMPIQRLRVPSKGAASQSPSGSRRSPSNSSCRRHPSKSSDRSDISTKADEEPMTRQTSTGSNASLPDVKTPALILSRQLNLDFHEVKFMLQILQEEHENRGYDGMDLASFHEMVLHVLGVTEIPSELLQEAYERCKAGDGPCNPRQFLTWYRDHIFSLTRKPTGDEKKADDLTLSLAKKHKCSCIDLDKIKLQYDSYDLDKSGVIEYNEFELMMLKLLHVASKSDLPQNRIQRFWAELDRDRSGAVDFSEFTEWYLKYFNIAQEAGPIEAFYASFGPDFQRTASLEAMGKTMSENAKPRVPASIAQKEKEKEEQSKSSDFGSKALHRRMTIG